MKARRAAPGTPRSGGDILGGLELGPDTLADFLYPRVRGLSITQFEGQTENGSLEGIVLQRGSVARRMNPPREDVASRRVRPSTLGIVGSSGLTSDCGEIRILCNSHSDHWAGLEHRQDQPIVEMSYHNRK